MLTLSISPLAIQINTENIIFLNNEEIADRILRISFDTINMQCKKKKEAQKLNDQFENDMNRDRRSFDNERIEQERYERETARDSDPGSRDSNKDKVLVGIFENENEAINVIRRLRETGYREDEITVVAKDKDQMEHIDDTTDVDTKSQSGNEMIGAGAAVGGTIGGIAAALPFLGLLVIPGIGPLLAAGPIAGILGGVIAGGVAGGLVGGLVQLGVREEDAKEYEQHIEQGKILVLVENRENLRDDVHTTYRQYNSRTVGDRSRER